MRKLCVLVALCAPACETGANARQAEANIAERGARVDQALSSIRAGTSLDAALGTLEQLQKDEVGIVKRVSQSETKEIVTYAYDVQYGPYWNHKKTIFFSARRADGEIVQVTR